MPVFLRTRPLELPAPSERDWLKKDEEEAFFLKDPDQIIDDLPQPFRMINKVVAVLFEQAWDIIEEREKCRVAKKRHQPPAQYWPSAELQVVGRANCLAASREYIFIGLSTGLSVFSTGTYEKLCAWETAGVEICTLRASDLGNNCHILGAVDEMGFARLFYFSKENLFHVKAINEVEDVNKRNTCTELELSHGGDYAGFLLQGNTEIWLEIYRFPKDSWQKEVEHVQTVALQTPGPFRDQRCSMSMSSQKNVDFRILEVQTESTEEQDLQQVLNCKLSPPALLMKIRSPKPLTVSPFKTPFEAVMKSDDGTVIGLGQNHMIKDSQWERLEAIFKSTFQEYLEVENEVEKKEEKVEKLSHAVFHFHRSGRTLPIGVENKTEPDIPVAVCVHWSTSNNLCFYLLSRPPKEKPDSDPKPDIVWPCAAPVVLSAITPCSSYLAFACEDGVINVWDKSVGLPLFVTTLPDGYVARSIQFMPCPQLPGHKALFPSKDPALTNLKILVFCMDGSLHLMTFRNKQVSSKLLVYKTVDPGHALSAVATIPSLTNAVLTCSWDGTVSLLDTNTEATICHFVTPPPYKVATPWQPVFTISTDSQYLSLHGDQPSGKIKAETESMQSTIFLFDITSCHFPETQEDKIPPDSLEHLPWDSRCDFFINKNLKRMSVVTQEVLESRKRLWKHQATLQRQDQAMKQEHGKS